MRYILTLAALLAVGCGGSSSPAAPTAPPAPACQTNNTATVTVSNASVNGFTFDVLIDNITRGTIAPGRSAGPITVTAGANHTISSRVTNTNIVACSSTTSFVQCSAQTLTCSK